MADNKTIAATIAAILVAHGKTTAEHIARAIEVYQQCLGELTKAEQVEEGARLAEAAHSLWSKKSVAKSRTHRGSRRP